MRVYSYSDEEILKAIGKPSSNSLRLEGPLVEKVDHPNDAEIIVCPEPLTSFPKIEDMRRLPYFNGNDHRHAFFACTDAPKDADREAGNYMYTGLQSIMLKCSVRKWTLEHTPNALNLAWPVHHDDVDAIAFRAEPFTHDVGFHGWLSSTTRSESVASCLRQFGSSADIDAITEFYGSIHATRPAEAAQRRAGFLSSLGRCRVQLCPSSIPGDFPYRFWEAMLAGRVPVGVMSGHVLPRGDEIDYSEFSLFIPVEDAKHAGPIISDFLRRTPDSKLREMGEKGRHVYLRYLTSNRWPMIHSEMIYRKGVQLGIVKPFDTNPEAGI